MIWVRKSSIMIFNSKYIFAAAQTCYILDHAVMVTSAIPPCGLPLLIYTENQIP